MMRWRGFLIAIMLATAPAAPAVAQTATAAEQAAALAGPWRGIWHRDDPYYQYAGVMTLTPKAGGRVEGAISWTLLRSPLASEQAKIGMKGIEYVEGQYDPATGALNFAGVKVDDPNRILGMDRYRLVMSENGKVITGLTRGDGAWLGQLDLLR